MTFSAVNLKMWHVPQTAFSKWLNDNMERLGLTQEALGNKVGVSHVAVSRWQRGIHTPEPLTLKKLAELFEEDVFTAAHLAYEWPLVAGEQVTEADLARYRDIIAALEFINDDGLRLLVDQIRYVLRGRYPRRDAPNPGGVKGSAEDGE